MNRAATDQPQAGTDWELIGRDSRGGEIRITATADQLAKLTNGLAIGRHRRVCDFVVPDETMSRRHFRLLRTADGLMIEDLHSLNGTYIDGWRLEPFQLVPLRDGMAITAGHVRLTANLVRQA